MKSLDEHIEFFKERHDRLSAFLLLREGLTYWQNKNISDATFDNDVIKPVLDWLKSGIILEGKPE